MQHFDLATVKKQLIGFDWQGHRGARGLYPENGMEGFTEALLIPQVKTLEMDLAITKDRRVVLSHEPWLNYEICTGFEGSGLTKEQGERLRIFDMTYEELAQYDCGSIGHPRFPEQKPRPCFKPTLEVVLEESDAYARTQKRPLPLYNMEIKSEPDYDNKLTPALPEFVDLVRKIVEERRYAGRICIQSFDPRALNEYYKQTEKSVFKPQFALLVENVESIDVNLAKLNFKPDIYSCYYKLLTKKKIEALHSKGILVIPWTVNEVTDMQNLIEMGVNGIITDYPNRIPKVLEKYSAK